MVLTCQVQRRGSPRAVQAAHFWMVLLLAVVPNPRVGTGIYADVAPLK